MTLTLRRADVDEEEEAPCSDSGGVNDIMSWVSEGRSVHTGHGDTQVRSLSNGEQTNSDGLRQISPGKKSFRFLTRVAGRVDALNGSILEYCTSTSGQLDLQRYDTIRPLSTSYQRHAQKCSLENLISIVFDLHFCASCLTTRASALGYD